MDARLRIGLLALASVAVAGCATGQRLGQRLGWTGEPALASATVRASCDTAVATLRGQPDHATALAACLEAKTRQGVD